MYFLSINNILLEQKYKNIKFITTIELGISRNFVLLVFYLNCYFLNFPLFLMRLEKINKAKQKNIKIFITFKSIILFCYFKII